MYDQPPFLQTLSRFAAPLSARYDLDAALSELTESVTAVLGLCTSGITMAEVGGLRFVTRVTDAAWELERDHAHHTPALLGMPTPPVTVRRPVSVSMRMVAEAIVAVGLRV